MRSVTAIALSAALIGLAGCTKKAAEPVAVNEPNATATADVAPTVDQAIDAVLRGHPRSQKVCYETKYDGYFLYYGPISDDTTKLSGWFLIQNIGFYQSTNNTFFISTQPDKNYVTVFPDVTGLPCKERNNV